MSDRSYRHAIHAILAISLILRVWLALVNREANDDHIEIARLILNEHRLPDINDCSECFQPKLYHATLAGVFAIFPHANANFQIQIANLLNVVAGFFTILVVWLFLKKLQIQNRVKFFAISLMALNPSFVGINGQATNDSFVILFGTLAVYYAYYFFSDRKMYRLLLSASFTVLAILTKPNGIVTFVAIALSLGLLVHLPMMSGSRRLLFLRAFVLFLLVCPVAAFIAPPGQYRYNLERYGSLTVLNVPRPNFPHFFKKTYTSMAGVRSVADSFLTFRIFVMLKYPSINYSNDDYPLHRTCFWSQVYGRSQFMHYDAWPPSWVTIQSGVLNIGRFLFVLALIPVAALFVGVLAEVFTIMKDRNSVFVDAAQSSFLLLVFFGFLGFLVLYSLLFRGSGAMKAIFLYPGILTFPYFFAKGFSLIEKWLSNQSKVLLGFYSAIVIVLFLYLLDEIFLIVQLAQSSV